MSIKCSNCGNKIPEGNAFCTECGSPAPKSEAVEKKPISENVFHNEVKNNTKPLHWVAYFFLLLLFAIPVVGLIASIAMSASSKNDNTANLGKAVFIWKIIILFILLIAFIVLLVTLRKAGLTLGYIGQTFNDAFAFLKK